jgi:hypothetical protein
MKGKFETMHDIQITEEGVTKLLFTGNTCQGHWTVIYSLKFLAFLKDGTNKSSFPNTGYFPGVVGFPEYIKDQIVTPYLRSKQMEYYIQTPKIRPTF